MMVRVILSAHPKKINNMIENIISYEKKISSQRGQDGIIEAIFNTIGTTNKFFVEFGIHQHEVILFI